MAIQRSKLLGYAVATVTVVSAILLTLPFPFVRDRSPYLMFFAAVAVSAWYGGLGPGLVAVALSAASLAYFFLPPDFSLAIVVEDGLPLAVFVLVAVLISSLHAAHLRAERALLQEREELKRSNADLEQFAYVASHDLQEPLRMVASYMQLLAERYRGKLDAEADEFIKFAVDGATRMQALIDDLLEYSRVGRDNKPVERTECSVVLEQALANLQAPIRERGAVVTHGPLPVVLANGNRLTQVFQNLIGNAIKFCEQKPPQVHIEADLREREWLLSVRDNGIGIAPEHADRVFLLFQRLHGRRKYPGTGVGLALCKKIVEQHGGRIWVESQPGHGSVFYFTLAENGKRHESSIGRKTH